MSLVRRYLSLAASVAVAASGAAMLAPAAHASAVHASPAHTTAKQTHAKPRRPAPARQLAGTPAFGPNVYVFTPSMPQSQIQATVDSIATQQVPNQFGTQRYTLLFEPGTYGSAADPLIFQVGYYTQVAGLGASPGDVVINGSVDVFNQCFPTGDPNTTNCIALDNFWRSLSNLTINPTGLQGCQANTEFWAVSQAAPLRRVQVNGLTSFMDYCSAGPQFASGGFVADSVFANSSVTNGSQQQFIVRNSSLDGWSNGVWNQVFVGDNGAPAQAFGQAGGAGPYTTVAASPVAEEEPFLYTDASGSFRVFVPAVQHNTTGPSWSATTSTPGTSEPISRFFIANPDTSVARINLALALGQNLILTPGVYNISQPIIVSRSDTVVLGLGLATLIPTRGNSSMLVASPSGVKISGLIFDAGPVNSRVLLDIGLSPLQGSAAAPTLIQDTYFRIGGAEAGEATNSLIVNSSHAILDNIWGWRADHGAGVGWTDNTADHGLIVNGDDVTAYGLFIEHYQKTQVIWRGENGSDFFFQNELPYDPPSQAAWMANSTTNGYPAFEVANNVRTFSGFGLGSYSFFELGIPIMASESFKVPASAPGVQLHDLLTVFLSGSGGIDSVVDGVGAPVMEGNGGPSDVVTFP